MNWDIQEAISYYKTQGAPADQNALVNLLREVQEESGLTRLRLVSPEVYSLDAAMGEDSDTSVGMMLPGDEELEPHAVLIRQEMKALLDEMLGKLDERQQRILRLRYGMGDGICLSREEIAGQMGLSRERIRQIEHQAIKRLNKLGAELGLEDFLE